MEMHTDAVALGKLFRIINSASTKKSIIKAKCRMVGGEATEKASAAVESGLDTCIVIAKPVN